MNGGGDGGAAGAAGRGMGIDAVFASQRAPGGSECGACESAASGGKFHVDNDNDERAERAWPSFKLVAQKRATRKDESPAPVHITRAPRRQRQCPPRRTPRRVRDPLLV
jgi:hypothetical protein